LLPQTIECRRGFKPDVDKMKGGLWLILTGIVKKVVVADMLLEFAAPALAAKSPYDISVGSSWMAVGALMLMLYADFSAYSDLARGFGFMLGFTIPINFRAPFLMHSLSEFWKRWHLTFSLWIRDYIFIPLGGSRVSEWRVYVNFVITFFLGGLWHGASYSFVIWGTVIGIVLSIEGFLDRRGIKETPATLPGKILRGLVTYAIFVPISAFFFAPSFEWALKTTLRLYGGGGSGGRTLENPLVFLAGFLAVAAFHLAEEKPDVFRRLRRYESWLLPVCGIAVALQVLQFSVGAKDFFDFGWSS
ncbi:MAG: MBOAT family protein, partial [Spirochaetia bacterium]|nr:MBOAT family protein [Spirochaetia bacterium]